MPLLKIQTNQTIDAASRQVLLSKASQTVAEFLGKPERYVMVTLKQAEPMLFGGDASPCVYLELKSIGLPEGRTGELSATLTTLMESELGVAADRVYIEFADAQRHMWGWNGATTFTPRSGRSPWCGPPTSPRSTRHSSCSSATAGTG